DFAQCVARQCVEHVDILRNLVGCKALCNALKDFGNDSFVCAACERDESEHTLTQHRVGLPTTAASSTAGWDATSASSTSTGEILVPPRIMMSFLRDTNHRSSPSPRRIRSPV